MTGPALSDFEIGTRYEVEAEGGVHPLTLAAAEPLPRSTREAGGFRLEFLGPADPVLPQATYPFRGGDGELDIFIVPVGREQAGVRYEAIYY